MDLTLLGNRIRVAREKMGITQEDLADRVNIGSVAKLKYQFIVLFQTGA